MTRDASALRRRLNELRGDLAAICETALRRQPLWRGIVYELRRRCGKRNCHCADGEPHASTVLADRREGRQKIVALPPGDLAVFRRLTDRYRKLRQGRARLVKIHREMLQILDRLEALRLEEGERRFGARLSRRERQRRGAP